MVYIPNNLSEWLYICNNSSTDDRDPLTTLIAPVAIIPRGRYVKENFLKFRNHLHNKITTSITSKLLHHKSPTLHSKFWMIMTCDVII